MDNNIEQTQSDAAADALDELVTALSDLSEKPGAVARDQQKPIEQPRKGRNSILPPTA